MKGTNANEDHLLVRDGLLGDLVGLTKVRGIEGLSSIEVGEVEKDGGFFFKGVSFKPTKQKTEEKEKEEKMKKKNLQWPWRSDGDRAW